MLEPLTTIFDTTPPVALGFQVGSTVLSDLMCARLLRATPPMVVKSPPTYQPPLPSGAIACMLSPNAVEDVPPTFGSEVGGTSSTAFGLSIQAIAPDDTPPT